jgi:hypothetical protein
MEITTKYAKESLLSCTYRAFLRVLPAENVQLFNQNEV